MLKYRKQGRGIALLTLFVINMIFITLNFAPTIVKQDDPAAEQSPETIDSLSSEDMPAPSTAAFEKVDSWWNETFRYRIEVQITEPDIISRPNDAVTVWLSFDYGVHSLNSTRVTSYDAGLWTEIPCQVWNKTVSGDFILGCSISFIISISQSQSKLYFVYYTDNFVENKTAIYTTQTGFTTTFNGNSVAVDNGQIEVQLANQTAFNSLKIKGETRNYHVNSSLAPSSALPSKEPTFYYPNMTSGFITDWLVIGPFLEDNYNVWNNFQTNLQINNPVFAPPWRNFVDLNKSYVEGDYGSGATVNSTYINQIYTKQWIGVHFNDPTGSGIVNFNNYFSPNDYRSAYALAYVYSPADQSVFVKACSDDSIRVYIDGMLAIDATRALRGIGYGNDQSFSGATITLKQGWTRVLVMCGENGGDWGFRLRFSTVGSLQSVYGAPPGVVTNIKIALAPVSFIDAQGSNAWITEQQNGPVFAQYNYQWADSEDMKAWDNVTFYQGMNMYKVERKLWFSKWHTTNPRNNSFAALNTFYAGTSFDEYIYDGQTVTGLSSTTFQATNYTVIRDRTGDNALTTLGVFITNLSKGYSYFQLDYLKWKVTYSSGVVNFLPGNWTDFDNLASYSSYAGNENRYITVTFWEYLKDDVGEQYLDATAVVDSVYQGLMNPVDVEIYRGNNESLFFNLDVSVQDMDGNLASNVNVTLINATDGNGWNYNWNQPAANQSQLTDASGVAHFVRLTQANYTVNLTYSAYGHAPIPVAQYNWGQTNVTLNTSQTVYLENIPLTKLRLTFRQYDPVSSQYKGMIIGGNVTFYTNVSNVLEEIGSINTDSNGLVEFYWISYPESVANTTFGIEFLGGPQYISYNETLDFVSNITLPMVVLSSHSIGVRIGEFSTNLPVLSSSLDNTRYWGETLTVTVNYTYTVMEAGFPVGYPISGATVNYHLSSDARGIFNTSSFVSTASPGVYNFSFASDASWLELRAGVTYTMLIEAEKAGFTPYTISVTIVLKNVTAYIQAEQELFQLYWNENFTARLCYLDSLNAVAIEGATLRYQVATRPSIQGMLIEEGLGWYNFTLNSTAFTYADSYVLTITASKDNYYTNTTTIDLRIQKIKTYIGTWLAPNRQSITVQEVINVNVTTSLLMYFNYSTATGIGIPAASVIEYEWEDPLGNKYNGFLADAGDGIYNLDFDTATKPLGKYSLVITIGQTNYVERVAVIALYIIEKPISVTPVGFTQGQTVKRPQGEDITISVDLYDPVAGAPLSGATVHLFFDGEYRAISPSSTPGRYEITLPTGSYNAMFAQIDFPSKIRVTMANYTQTGGEYLFTIAIAPPEWFGIPQIYWIMIISTVAIVVVAFAIVKAVQYSRIPQFVRDLDKTGTSIRKNKSIGRENISETRGESISKSLDHRFAAIGMSAAEKFAPKEAVSKEETKGERKPEEEVA